MNSNHTQNKMVKNKDLAEYLLLCILHSNILIGNIDALAGTEVYVQSLKNKGNMFLRELERFANKYTDLTVGLDNEDYSLHLAVRNIEGLAKNIVEFNTSDYAIVSKIIQLYRQDSEAVMAALNVNLQHIKCEKAA